MGSIRRSLKRACLLFSLCSFLVPFGAVPPAAAGTAEAIMTADAARISEVTVYRDRAEVIREVRLAVPAGASTVEFAGIPNGVEADSVRIQAEGVPAVLGAVEVVQRVEKAAETPEFVAARAALRRLDRSIAEKNAEQSVDDELRQFLKSVQATTAESGSRELGEGRADPEAIAAFYDLLAGRLAGLATKRIDRAEALTALREDRDLAQARLNATRGAGDVRSRVATVGLAAERSGSMTLRLAYVVPGARWYPSYRATLDSRTGDVNWVTEGVVRQGTGEDWGGVDLRLSTAAPARGVEPPFLTARVLNPITGQLALRGPGGFAISSKAFYQNAGISAPGVADSPDLEANTAHAALVRSAYNVSFDVPGDSDVPADGRDHRVVLRSDTLRGNLVHRTVPGMSALAYLTSVTTSPSDYPLLAGAVRVFAEGAYLGSFQLEETGPGAELTLPFGADNRLEVIRVAVPRSAGKQGLAGKQREVEYAYRTQLHNLQDRTVTLVLEDRVPVSEDERIAVQLDNRETTAGFRDSPRRPGVKLLTLELEPGEKKEVHFAYSVRYPKDLIVAGLE